MSEPQSIFKIDIKDHRTIEERLTERAADGKCMMCYWNEDGTFTSWFSNNLNYYEKLFIIDSLKRRMTYEINQDGREDE